MASPAYIADFDSSSAMLRATARYLHGKGFPRLGLAPYNKVLSETADLLPEGLREWAYAIGGSLEGSFAKDLDRVSSDELRSWVVDQYPRRRYPALAIGSANGAAVHLYTALGIPWLPQTFLLPMRRFGVHPDDMRAELAWGMENAGKLLSSNPDLQLHHMADPNQDRLMIQYMTYFRVKLLQLGNIWTRFIEESLAPGGTIFLIECTRTWPTTKVNDRHFFQAGATGGLAPEEYLQGSERVAEYLARYDSPRRAWDPPQPDAERPEAEWGFAPALGEDVARLAAEKGYQIRRIRFEHPQDFSPIVADFYRWWYDRRGITTSRLLVESFILMEPWWALRTASIPYWMKFNVESSAEGLEAYLDQAGPFEEINMMLLSHGTESAGLVPIERWQALLDRASKRGRWIGVTPDKYPRDFGVFGRYSADMQQIAARHPMPEPLPLAQLDEFLDMYGDRYAVEWTTGAV